MGLFSVDTKTITRYVFNNENNLSELSLD
jgi:hypothetical protein